MKREWTLALIVVVSLAGCSGPISVDSHESAASQENSEETSEQHRQVAWNLLWFDKERFVKKVRIKLYRFGGFVDRPAVEAEVESDDPLVLRNFTVGLTNGLHFTPRPGELEILSRPFGELEVITNKDFFKLYFDNEFVLEEEYWRQDCSFFCWTLAKAIDDLLADKGGKHLTPAQFEELSGENWLKSERKDYEKRAEAASARGDGDSPSK